MDWRAASTEDRFKEAERRIEEVRRTGVTYLNLGDLGLSELPSTLAQIDELRELFIGEEFRGEQEGIIERQGYHPYSEITSFGPISRLLKLQSLSLGNCNSLISTLAPLSKLSSLRRLSLDNCQLLKGDLTPLTQLFSLQELSLFVCPALIGDLAPLAQLAHLETLSLSYCPALVRDLTPLAALSHLKRLRLSLHETPADSLAPLAQLSNLQELSIHFSYNLFGDLTPLAHLSKLHKLELFFCPSLVGDLAHLARLPNLVNLTLCYCHSLTGDLTPLLELPRLEKLTIFPTMKLTCDLEPVRQLLRKNPPLSWFCCNSVKGIPAEILSGEEYHNCLPELQSYLTDLAAGEVGESDVKLILLGNGRVGKTQLCRRLRNEEFEQDSISTHGVKLWRQPLQLRKDGMESTSFANWWDFGGQDIYHSTHSLFLRSRAVFLILWTPHLENSEEFEENGIPMRNQPLAYWLDYVRSLAGTDSPIIIVQSQCESFAAKREPPTRASGFQYAEYCEFGAVNDHRRERLEGLIHDAIRYLGERTGKLLIGAGRAELRRRLYEMRDADQFRPEVARLHRTIDRTSFETLCQEVGGISSPEHALSYLHQTGVVFHQKGLFGDLIVLDQSWALDAVYSVFDRARALPLLRENGRFTRRDLEQLCWRDKSQEEQMLLLGLMQSCGICFVNEYDRNNEEHTYLAPDLLPDFERVKKQIFAWDYGAEEVGLGLEYRFLHQALLRSLLSRIGGNVGENAIYWKYGLWVRKQGGTQLLIRREDLASADTPGAGRLWIAAQGPGSVEFVKQIRKKLDKLSVVEKPGELLRLAGATVRRSDLESAIDKIRTIEGKVVDSRPFVSFWSERCEELQPSSGGPKFMTDAAPLDKKPLKVFYSYAHEDERFRDELAKHLKPLERERLLETWHDRALDAGVEWDEEIRRKLHEADIILLLVSIDFMASDYIWGKELTPALERHEKKEARVIPVILRTCEWGTAPFSKLQALPLGAKAVTTWSDRDAAYTTISKALREIADKRP